MSTVTIGFTPRERFSLAAESLQRIFDCTSIPFDLIVVDCNTPPVYWQQMEKVLSGRKNVKIIQRDHYLLPNQSRNLVIREAKDDFLCFIENDVLVQDGWLPSLIAACEDHPADVAVPLIMEGPIGRGKIHFDDLLGSLRSVQGSDGVKWEILPRTSPKTQDRGSHRRTAVFMEQHCLLFRRDVFDRIGPYDEKLNTRDEIDLGLALYHANVPVVFEPRCEVHYLPPYPPQPDELEYFFMKWDIEQALKSRDHIQKKWNLVSCPGDMGFVKARNLFGQMSLTGKELKAIISPAQPFILADEDWWRGTEIVKGLLTIPFLEKDGKYWGLPADDDTAIKEFERLCNFGPSFIVFGWPAYFCWSDRYPGLDHYLRSRFHCVLENERLIVFNLRSSASLSRTHQSQ